MARGYHRDAVLPLRAMKSPRVTSAAAAGIAAAILQGWSGPALADKTDVVYLKNGDRVTCEIKNMQRGRLKVSTDSMSTVYIEWKDILRVTSKELYVIELQDGTRLEGTFGEAGAEGQLLLQAKEAVPAEAAGPAGQAVAMRDVIWVDPLKVNEAIIRQWDGSISAGFDTTKANHDTSLSASFDARRRAEDYVLNFSGSVYSRSQDDAEDSLRADFSTVYRGLLEDRWYWAGLGALERNDELGIDLRTLAGAGYGRYLVQTGRTLWSVTGGLAAVNEQRAGTEDAENSIEAFFNTDYEFFTYDTPKTTVMLSLTLFPSLTESDRVRGQAEFSLRRELIPDLFIELNLYGSLDSEPPEEGEDSDYGIVTSLGYTF